jgi:hypothetical protein
LGLGDVELSLGLVVVFLKTLNFSLFLVNFKPMPPFDVFLNFHPENIGVNGQDHLGLDHLDLLLLLLDQSPHLRNPVFLFPFRLLPSCDGFRKSSLGLGQLALDVLMVALEVLVQSGYLVSLLYA